MLASNSELNNETMSGQSGSIVDHIKLTNPFSSERALHNSAYTAFSQDRIAFPLDPERKPSPLMEFVHDSFRALVLNQRFTCVAAKSAIRQGDYRFGLYSAMDTSDAIAALAYDLWSFTQEQRTFDSNFTTFVASFMGPVTPDEATFEDQLWKALQQLHNLDHQFHGWDPAVSENPADRNFGFSFAGRAFFVVGLHAACSRWTRRFAWPTLVFNAHHQFELLKEQGKFERMQDVIRTRDYVLQGDINTMLSNFGERSEARQYAGRTVEPDWSCPFQAHEPTHREDQ